MAAKVDTHAVVFIVDDDDAIREALANLLCSVGLQVRAFPTASEFLEHSAPSAAACLVLDVRLPGLGGLPAGETRAPHRHTDRVRPATATSDGVRAMKAGAVEFLVKPFREQDLLDAVAAALERDRDALEDRATLASLRARYATLSTREREVLARVARGMRNKQVAAELGVSEVTIKLHRHRVMQKMDARTLASLVRMYDRLHKAQESPEE
jgi:FixJ family two-component response regulator